MNIVVIGTNHKYSPVVLRERLSIPQKRMGEILLSFKGNRVLRGMVILSTCNRMEIYVGCDDQEAAIRELENFILEYYELERISLDFYFYCYRAEEAVGHLLSVACGLDSLVLGETQILNQIDQSLSLADNLGMAGVFLKSIFSSVFLSAKKVHNETEIAKGKASVGSVAVDFIKERLGSISKKHVLIIGVGKISGLLLKYLKKENPQVVFIANRTFLKAVRLARSIGAYAVRFNELKDYLIQADIVISATSSRHFIIKKELLAEVLPLRKKESQNILIIDLALPRDVDPKVKEIEGVELFYLDDLKSVIQKNIQDKEEKAKKAQLIVTREKEKIWEKVIALGLEPALLP